MSKKDALLEVETDKVNVGIVFTADGLAFEGKFVNGSAVIANV